MTLTHEGRKLVGSVYLKGDKVGPLTVRLKSPRALSPAASSTRRACRSAAWSCNNLGQIHAEPPPDRAMLPEGDSRPGRWSAATAGSASRVSFPASSTGGGRRRDSMGLGESSAT